MRFEEAVEKYQPLSPYERGLVAGIYRFAWMKDGAYYVGTTGSLLGDGIADAISEHRESLAGRQPETDVAPDLPRPTACPRRGEVQAFDAGWGAHRVGLERETVRVLSAGSGMALLGWDARERVAVEETART